MLEHQVPVLICRFFSPILRQQVFWRDLSLLRKLFKARWYFTHGQTAVHTMGKVRSISKKERQYFQVLTPKVARNTFLNLSFISVMNDLNAICV